MTKNIRNCNHFPRILAPYPLPISNVVLRQMVLFDRVPLRKLDCYSSYVQNGYHIFLYIFRPLSLSLASKHTQTQSLFYKYLLYVSLSRALSLSSQRRILKHLIPILHCPKPISCFGQINRLGEKGFYNMQLWSHFKPLLSHINALRS